MTENQWITVALSALALLGTIANGFIGAFKQKTELQHNAKVLDLEAKGKYQQDEITKLKSESEKQQANHEKVLKALEICDQQHDQTKEHYREVLTELAVMRAKIEQTVPTPVLHVPATVATPVVPPSERKG